VNRLGESADESPPQRIILCRDLPCASRDVPSPLAGFLVPPTRRTGPRSPQPGIDGPAAMRVDEACGSSPGSCAIPCYPIDLAPSRDSRMMSA
jgi:hypothetical protein